MVIVLSKKISEEIIWNIDGIRENEIKIIPSTKFANEDFGNGRANGNVFLISSNSLKWSLILSLVILVKIEFLWLFASFTLKYSSYIIRKTEAQKIFLD